MALRRTDAADGSSAFGFAASLAGLAASVAAEVGDDAAAEVEENPGFGEPDGAVAALTSGLDEAAPAAVAAGEGVSGFGASGCEASDFGDSDIGALPKDTPDASADPPNPPLASLLSEGCSGPAPLAAAEVGV